MLSEREFREVVAEAIDALPEEFRNAVQNVEIVVEEMPSPSQIALFAEREGGDVLLLGLYEGVPLAERSTFDVARLPDKISLFRRPLEAVSHTRAEMAAQIRITLLHELGHYFGMDDDELHHLGY